MALLDLSKSDDFNGHRRISYTLYNLDPIKSLKYNKMIQQYLSNKNVDLLTSKTLSRHIEKAEKEYQKSIRDTSMNN
jgi:hypothetical protein